MLKRFFSRFRVGWSREVGEASAHCERSQWGTIIRGLRSCTDCRQACTARRCADAVRATTVAAVAPSTSCAVSLDEPCIITEMDQNSVDRDIRPKGIAAKSWMYIGHPEAGWRSAVIYSITGTCRVLKINRMNCLTGVLPRLAAATNGQVVAVRAGLPKVPRDQLKVARCRALPGCSPVAGVTCDSRIGVGDSLSARRYRYTRRRTFHSSIRSGKYAPSASYEDGTY